MVNNDAFRKVSDAIGEGDVELLSSLLSDWPEWLRLKTPFGSWLHLAAMRGQLGIVRELVERFQVDIDEYDDPGDPCAERPISCAAE